MSEAVAALDLQDRALADHGAVAWERHLERQRCRIVDRVDEARGLARADLVAELEGRLEQAAAVRVDVVLRPAHLHQPRPVARRGGRGHDAVVAQHIAHAGMGDLQGVAGHGAGAAELGAESDDPDPVGGGEDGPVFAALAHDVADRRPERLECCDLGGEQRIVRAVLPDQGARDVIEGLAARVQVDRRIAQGQQDALDEMGDRRGRAAVRVAGKAPVEVAAVDRRAALAGERRRQIRRRQHDQPTLDLAGIEAPDQVQQRNLALVLVAVVAGAEVERGPWAVADHADRDADPAVGRGVAGVRQLQVADLLAVPIEVDEAADPGFPAHFALPATHFALPGRVRSRQPLARSAAVRAFSGAATPTKLGAPSGRKKCWSAFRSTRRTSTARC